MKRKNIQDEKQTEGVNLKLIFLKHYGNKAAFYKYLIFHLTRLDYYEQNQKELRYQAYDPTNFNKFIGEAIDYDKELNRWRKEKIKQVESMAKHISYAVKDTSKLSTLERYARIDSVLNNLFPDNEFQICKLDIINTATKKSLIQYCVNVYLLYLSLWHMAKTNDKCLIQDPHLMMRSENYGTVITAKVFELIGYQRRDMPVRKTASIAGTTPSKKKELRKQFILSLLKDKYKWRVNKKDIREICDMCVKHLQQELTERTIIRDLENIEQEQNNKIDGTWKLFRRDRTSPEKS